MHFTTCILAMALLLRFGRQAVAAAAVGSSAAPVGCTVLGRQYGSSQSPATGAIPSIDGVDASKSNQSHGTDDPATTGDTIDFGKNAG